VKYTSTRDPSLSFSFSEALAQGLAPEGGLFIPEEFPSLDLSEFSVEQSYAEFAAKLLKPFLQGDLLQALLPEICQAAFNFPIPLRYRKDDSAVLELFHGPTAAFKDVGARFLAECLMRTPSSHLVRTVLVATSGDTGGAVAGAFFGKPGIEVYVLFPKGKISLRQEKQIACWGGNVRAFAVQGSFDDCQKIVKEALGDSLWRRKKEFLSANSISVGRLLPQMVYYAKSSLEYRKARGVVPGVIVPTGNLGNAVAALWAKRLGFPLGTVILATNANRSIGDYFASGVWEPRPTVTTLANAMDVGNPSNMERLRVLYPRLEDLKKDVATASVSDAEISEEIQRSFRENREIYCPHTATSLVAQRKMGEGGHWILVSTAHPAKFETIVEPLIGQSVPVPPALAALLQRPSVYEEIPPHFAEFKKFVEEIH